MIKQKHLTYVKSNSSQRTSLVSDRMADPNLYILPVLKGNNGPN